LADVNELINRIKHVLVVSCQASEGEPLCHPSHITALAQSAITGGAKGLRLEGADNIRAVRAVTNLPIIGLAKSHVVAEKDRLKSVYITSTKEEATAIAEAGSDIIAIDATGRLRPGDLRLAEFIQFIQRHLRKPVLADVATLAQGIAAVKAGADLVSTTLYGYTEETELPSDAGPALDMLRSLVQSINVPVILEGRVWQPSEVASAFADGAHAVIVGSAITRPQLITERFVRAVPKSLSKNHSDVS